MSNGNTPSVNVSEMSFAQLEAYFKAKQAEVTQLLTEATAKLKASRDAEANKSVTVRTNIVGIRAEYEIQLEALKQEIYAKRQEELNPLETELQEIEETYAKEQAEIIATYEAKGIVIPENIKSGKFTKVPAVERSGSRSNSNKLDESLITDAKKDEAIELLRSKRKMTAKAFNAALGLNWKESRKLTEGMPNILRVGNDAGATIELTD